MMEKPGRLQSSGLQVIKVVIFIIIIIIPVIATILGLVPWKQSLS